MGNYYNPILPYFCNSRQNFTAKFNMNNPTGHIIEVYCSLTFNPNVNDWDSTYFGKYHDKLIGLGYTEKQEKKNINVHIDIKPGSQSLPPKREESINFIFRNKQKMSAILIGPHFVSFHKLAPYTNYKDLVDDILTPGLEKYKELGIGKELSKVQFTYINRMPIEDQFKGVYEKFKIIEPIEGVIEEAMNFQGSYAFPDGVKGIFRLNWNRLGKDPSKAILFECTTFVNATKESTLLELINSTHHRANELYAQIKK